MTKNLYRTTLMLLTVLLCTTAWASDFSGGTGSEDDPYIISTSDDWNQLSTNVAAGTTYEDHFFQLNENITVTTMVGTNEHRFQGHFDGNKKKLTFNIYTREDYAAPFRYVNGANISNLHVDGTIASAAMFAAGLVANTVGGTTITNCRITITITCRRYHDVSHAGVVAKNSGGNLVIEGCTFDGGMIGFGTRNWAGFVGWNERKDDANGTVTISRCLFAPTKTEMRITKTFVRSHSYDDDIIKLTDCYCTASYGNDQDVCIYKLYNNEGVRVEYNCGNESKDYSVSGITFYNTAFTYDGQICAKSGNNLSLTIKLEDGAEPAPEGTTFNGFKTSAGKLTKNENEKDEYNLTIGNADAVIFANYVDESYNWTGDGKGTSEYPYIINTPERWDEFVKGVNSGQGDYANAHYQLTNDITVTTMAGTDVNKFQGFFYGSGHTLTINYGTEAEPFDEDYCAPFRYIDIADIHDLNVAGTIYTKKKYAAGIAGHAVGENSIENCSVSVAISSSVSGDGTHGGLVANIAYGNTTITGCAFNGSLTGSETYNCGGLVGWTNGNNDAAVKFSNCLFNPASLTFGTNGCATFARSRDNNTTNITLSNCYYTSSLGTVQGEKAYADTNSSSQPLVEKSIAGVSYYVPGELVTNITATPTPTGAIVSWTGSEGCTYQVRYRDVNSKTIYFCGFETYVEGWTQIDADQDGKCWKQMLPNDMARTGQGSIISYSFDPDEMKVLTPDNWLVSPQLTLGDKFSVWMRGADSNSYQEHFAIYLSFDGDFNNDDELIKLVPETEVTNEFQEYTADLSAYKGQTGYIAIRHFDCTDQFFLIVDDFGLYDTDAPWTTVENADAAGTTITGLENNTTIEYQVVYNYKGTDYYTPVATLTTLTDNPAPLDLAVTNVTANSAKLSWKGYSDSYNLHYRSFAEQTVNVTLNVNEDIWGDGTGYQMLLDAEHDTYDTVIPTDNYLNPSGDASAVTYAYFEYKIPENADGNLNTKNVVNGKDVKSVTINIPVGIYDWFIANPTPGDRVWTAFDKGNVAGQQNDFVFEAGKNYTFTVSRDGDNDRVDMTIEDKGSASSEWRTVNVPSTSCDLSELPKGAFCQVQVQSVKGEEQSDWTNLFFSTDNGPKNIELTDNGNNNAIITVNDGKECNVTLTGRTLYCDGSWNTLCLPFNVSEDELSDSPLKDFTIMELSNGGNSGTGFAPGTGTLTLDFVEAEGIEAGHAYIVKWGKEDNYDDDEDTPVNIDNPEFKNVTISDENPANQGTKSTDEYVTFLGTYDAISYTKNAPSVLYLGAENSLYYPSEGITIGACRAYFQLNKGLIAGELADPATGAANIRAFSLHFGDEATGIISVSEASGNEGMAKGWYTLDGRRLSGKPSTSGIYINNGKKVMVK